MTSSFEKANLENKQVSSDAMLPEGVYLQHALWNFDKGGYLQELLHALKYQRLKGLGIEMGKVLGKDVLENSFLSLDNQTILVPVPLHPKKRRMRGYNQARFIAKGVSEVTGIRICDQEDVLRIKNTSSQTGFTLAKRRKNIDQAFLVRNKEIFQQAECILVDDVFTTGATTFELAKSLIESGAKKTMIITVAQA
ncbi:MAG: ComF family protein [Balneola sp.]|nr:MAG: ComF family protein [Balneola sp.]